ncbi:MAG: RNA-binding protein [Candidatus Colwellbacteria bacterium CG10_big_fil_rev_8_21_14_0_10_41_28]|uniref:RNA-binding protein KhpA n=1 Tax=Candidatus Colwellbacteria bacterium CG10_big_fil_rev_8_21_14_0_10_41_28 TaxID=1974539 RepID=A0A2H0VHC7_9BACT|nr:MAG: RNA-binding protein [Candidatus Colwellbacteria bacterium CG10_big_fil_rev_8_21_14_0_10_41_28]
MAETHNDQEFLEFLVKSIVDKPEEVRVDRQVDEMGVLLTLHVSAQDMGQVVGRQGGTAKSIRSLLKIIGMKNNARVNLKIEEPEGGRRHQSPERRGREESLPEAPDNLGTTETVDKVINDIKEDL